jgi:hypothetical protein
MYDWIIDSLNAVWRHGWSLTALGTAIFALLKQRKVKAQLRKLIPWLFADDSEIRQYVQNQQRIESKIDALLEKEGIVWQSASSNGTTGKVSTRRIGFTSSWVGRSVVRGVVRCIIYLILKGKRTMPNINWGPLIAGIASAIKLALQPFGIEIPDEHINTVLNVIAALIVPVAIWVNHRHQRTVISEETVKSIQQAPKTYAEMVPIANEVHVKINRMFAELKSGKVTDASQEASEMYMILQEVLKKYQPPEEKKGA